MREVKCIWVNKIYDVDKIDYVNKWIDLRGSSIVSFDDAYLIENTGLKDINNKDIYTSYILQFKSSGRTIFCWVDYNPIYGEYVTRSSELYFDQEPLGDLFQDGKITDVRIVGSIYIKTEPSIGILKKLEEIPEESEETNYDLNQVVETSKQLVSKLQDLGTIWANAVGDLLKGTTSIMIEQEKKLKKYEEERKNEFRKRNRTWERT